MWVILPSFADVDGVVEGSSEETAVVVGIASNLDCAADGGSWTSCAEDGEIGSRDGETEISSEDTAGVVGASDDVADGGCWSEVVVAADGGSWTWRAVDGEIGSPAEEVEGS